MATTATLIKNKTEGTRLNRSLVDLIDALPDGKYRIIIEPHRVHHSIPQRKLLFMWLSLLSKETGNSKADLYKYYCNKFLTEDMPSVSEMSNYQLTDFMHHIEADVAIQLGWTLPVPADGDDFIEFYLEYRDR